MDIEALKRWFVQYRRALPWRDNPTPYAVWISEVMLQQTQVNVVIPYFERWMSRFPTVATLAQAESQDVIKMWEGLGYYSRARHLHSGARYILEYFNGCIPNDEKSLSQIKGLGPYTIGAIRSFAFKQKAAAVDGNVLRVLSRLYNVHEPINQPRVIKQLRTVAERLLPESEPWLAAEAFIELGATICTRKPLCGRCPLKTGCQAHSHGTQNQLPIKDRKIMVEKLFRAVAVIKGPKGLLLRKCGEGEVMSDLHEFPYFDSPEEGLSHDAVASKLPLPLNWQYSLSPVAHTFTRYRVKLNPEVFYCSEEHPVDGYEWKQWSEIATLAFSSGHRKVLQAMLKEECP